jgi:hypothetical protein
LPTKPSLGLSGGSPKERIHFGGMNPHGVVSLKKKYLHKLIAKVWVGSDRVEPN